MPWLRFGEGKEEISRVAARHKKFVASRPLWYGVGHRGLVTASQLSREGSATVDALNFTWSHGYVKEACSEWEEVDQLRRRLCAEYKLSNGIVRNALLTSNALPHSS